LPSSFDPNSFLIRLIVAVIAISIHEFAHAITADSLGDATARNQGRITLNPLAHFDPLGFFMLCLLAAGFFGADRCRSIRTRCVAADAAWRWSPSPVHSRT